jgi:hypothetical protein
VPTDPATDPTADSTDPGADRAREILATGARAIAHTEGRSRILEILLRSIIDGHEVESGAIFVPDARGGLELVAAVGLGEAARTGLVAAVRDPTHPVAKALTDPAPSFDVVPTRPGGPAMRSHLPLLVTRDGRQVPVGVMALAHEGPTSPEGRVVIRSVGDLAAVAIAASR